MNAELKAKWVAALRSGHYEQGRDALKTRDGKFCCLGVLCDVIDQNGWTENECGYAFEFKGEYHGGLLPASLQKDLGWTGFSVMGELITRNDMGRTFGEIAEYIEKEI
jgi:hypothetical protein